MAFDLLLVRAVIIAAAGDKNIQQTIAIVVNEAGAAAQGFHNGQVAGFLAVAKAEIDAGIGGAVGENRFAGRGWLRRWGRGIPMMRTTHHQPRTKNQEPKSKSQSPTNELGIWFLVIGIWFLVVGPKPVAR